MRNLMSRFDYRKVLIISLTLVLLLSLSGCATNTDVPLNGFKDESNVFEWLLVWPIGWVMNKIASIFGGSFGWGLIFTTLIVRTLAWPIYAGANNSMFKMQLAQDDLAKVNAKYLGRTDQASKQKQAMETQAVMKKHGVNMLGCLALPLQFPIFSAMFTVIKRITVEGGQYTLTNITFLGFNLNSNLLSGGIKNQIFCGFLVAIVVGLMFLQQKLAQKKPSYAKNVPNKNPQAEAMQQQMKFLLILSPVMMGFMASQDTGLALYWVVGTTFTIFQSFVTKKQQARKYYKVHANEMITPKDLKEAKQIKEKQQREIIEASSTETSSKVE